MLRHPERHPGQEADNLRSILKTLLETTEVLGMTAIVLWFYFLIMYESDLCALGDPDAI